MLAFDDYVAHDATGLAALVAAGDVSPTELLDCALARAAVVDPALNALTQLRPDTARRLIAAGLPSGPLNGVPFLLKDLGAEAIDFPSNAGSKLYANIHYRYDSTLYQRLCDVGLVAFGRTASPEFGIGPVTEAQVYGGPTRNPWQLDRTPGGSSGGSGAAVAAGIVPAAHGSDGGGSVRIPAACCGLYGLKSTRARLPDGPASGEGWGGMAIDGFLTRSVRDSAALFDATAGPELGAPYVAPPLAGSFDNALKRPPEPLRIAIGLAGAGGKLPHSDCRRAVEHTAQLLAELGHEIDDTVVDFSTELEPLMRAWSTVVACGTALTVRQRAPNDADVLRAGVDDSPLEAVTRAACRYAAGLSGADYLAALEHVHAFGRRRAVDFERFDMLLSPVLAEPPAEIGRLKPDHDDFLDYRLNAVLPYSPYTATYNASGQPAASLPLYWNDDGLPIGVQIAARFGDDERLLALSAQLERAQPWFDRRPPDVL